MTDRRMIHQRIWDSEQFIGLTLAERLLYIGLITWADDEGAFRANAGYWKRKVFYSDRIGEKQIEQKMKKIEKVGLIITGETKKGLIGCHPNWFDYQSLRMDRSKPSEYSELLVASGLPTPFTDAAQDKLSQVKLGQHNTSEVIQNQVKFAGGEVFPSLSAADQMRKGFEDSTRNKPLIN